MLKTDDGNRSRKKGLTMKEKLAIYEPEPGLMSKVSATISERPVLFRSIAIIAIVAGIIGFIGGSIFDFASPKNDLNNPNLDFNLENIVSASIALSKLAMERIRQVKEEHKEAMRVKGYTKEGKEEPVTVADAAANSVFINGFRTLFSNSKAVGNEDGDEKITFHIVSEETDPTFERVVPSNLEFVNLNDINGNKLLDPSKITLIIDPLDATVEYTEEVDADGSDLLSCVTTLVCVVEDGTPIAGVVGRPYAPEGEKDIIWAAVAQGKVHGQQPQVARGDAANKITISRSHTGDAGDIVSENFEGKEALKAGGAGYKSYLVLSGQAAAYIHTTAIKTWDLCAGHALLLAAGGDVTDKVGNELVYDNVDPKFHNGLVATLQKSTISEYTDVLRNIEFAAQTK